MDQQAPVPRPLPSPNTTSPSAGTARASFASLFLLFGSLLLVPSRAVADWVPVGPFGGDARSLVADPSNPDRMYLGTRTGQVYVSADGGKSWSRLSGFLAPPNWVVVVVDDLLIESSDPNKPREPSQPKGLYSPMWSLGSGGRGVFKSSDGGRSWTELLGMAGQPVRALAMAPSHPRTLIAGSLDGEATASNELRKPTAPKGSRCGF